MKVPSITIAALALLFISGQSSALTISQYKDMRSKGGDIADATSAFMSGMGAAYQSANFALELSKQPLLFCQPRTLSLRQDLLKQLIDREIQNPLYKQDDPIEWAAIAALKKAFPCH